MLLSTVQHDWPVVPYWKGYTAAVLITGPFTMLITMKFVLGFLWFVSKCNNILVQMHSCKWI